MDTEDELLLNCRLCANSLDRKKKILIFKSNSNQDSELCDTIYNILGIQILETDNLPKAICKKCDDMINNIQDFKRKCHQADRKLRKKFISNIEYVDVKVKLEEDEFNIPEFCPLNFVSVQHDIKLEEPNDLDISDKKIEDEEVLQPITVKKELDFNESKQVNFQLNEDSKDLSFTQPVRQKCSERKLFVCEICGVFTKTLSAHMSVHFKNRYNCPKCPNIYSHKGALQRHLLTHSDKKFLCEYCELTFSCQTYLTKHLKVHTGERNHICDICKKAFQTKYNLKTHMRIHTKEKPFKCNKCELAFAHRATFNIHTRECNNV